MACVNIYHLPNALRKKMKECQVFSCKEDAACSAGYLIYNYFMDFMDVMDLMAFMAKEAKEG